jgi:membrane-associated protease RseP (regulator of RpoE activity)
LNASEGAELWPGREPTVPGARRLAWFRSWVRFWWLNLFLFLATLVTTTVFGFALVQSFSSGRPFDVDLLLDAWVRLGRGDTALFAGLDFSAPLLLILLAHEFGHYLVCARREINASLPYFLPSPLLFGTFGAFIRIRSPIYTRKNLFDVGIAGPLAGFAVLLPFLIAGVCASHVAPALEERSAFLFGAPLAMRLIEWIKFPHASPSAIALHPMALAAWVGLFATAFNLLPLGQLDGGHILYAVFGQRGHRWVSTGMVALLALLGFLYSPWWVWAAVMFFLGRRHPLVYDSTPISKPRVLLSAMALLLFLVSISIVPVRQN